MTPRVSPNPHLEPWPAQDRALFLAAAGFGPWGALAWAAKLAGWL